MLEFHRMGWSRFSGLGVQATVGHTADITQVLRRGLILSRSDSLALALAPPRAVSRCAASARARQVPVRVSACLLRVFLVFVARGTFPNLGARCKGRLLFNIARGLQER